MIIIKKPNLRIMRGEEWGKIDWSAFYADNAFREKIPKNPYIAKQLKISHVLGKKIRIKMKPLQQLKKPNLFIWCFLWKRAMFYCELGPQLEKSHFVFRKKVDRVLWFWLEKPNFVIWGADREAICRPLWGKIWSTWWAALKEICCKKRISLRF